MITFGDPEYFLRMAERVRELMTVPQPVLQAMGRRCCELIVQRTHDGYDKDGKDFQEYSTNTRAIGGDYLQYATEAGGRSGYLRRGGETIPVVWFEREGYREFKHGMGYARVNLMVSGKLTGSKGYALPFDIVEYTDRGYVIDFTDSEERAKAENHVDGKATYQSNALVWPPPTPPIRDFWGVCIIPEEYDDVMSIGVFNYQAAIDEVLHGDGFSS